VSGVRANVSAIALVVLLLAVALLGQGAADRLAPLGGPAPTGRTLERAGFAYVSGLRTFAAAVLWNRIEGLLHGYYGNTQLKDQAYALPTVRMVTLLDPQFVQAYYVASWILATRGQVSEGVDLLRSGVENNPGSGLLRAAYSQILALFTSDLDLAVRQADLAMDADYVDLFEKHDSLASLRAAYAKAGRSDRLAALDREIERIDTQLGDALPPGSHDHDGDGKPDH
jgi:hypothetical protein